MEGAHSEKRIVHGGGDATGKNVVEFLLSTLKDNVTIDEDVFAYELLLNSKKSCIGVKAKAPDGTIKNYYSHEYDYCYRRLWAIVHLYIKCPNR